MQNDDGTVRIWEMKRARLSRPARISEIRGQLARIAAADFKRRRQGRYPVAEQRMALRASG